MKKYLFYSIAFVMLLTVLGEIIYPSTNTAWNVYYERQAMDTYVNGGIPNVDELSYLGRPTTFSPGYLDFKAGFFKLTGLGFFYDSNLLLKILINISLVLSCFYLASRLKMKPRQSLILFLGIFSQGFVTLWVFGYSLHMLGLSLFIFSLGYLAGTHKKILLVLAIAASGLVHTTYLIGFPFIAWALLDKKPRELLGITFVSFIIFAVFYSPVILRAGLPYAIEINNWGYGINGTIPDFLGYTLLWTAPFLIVLIKSLKKIDKLSAFTSILFASYFLMSYRVNIFLGILFSFLLVRNYEKDITKNRRFYALLIAIALINVAFLAYGNYGKTNYGRDGVLNEWVERSYYFLGAVPGENIASNPFFGHSIAYYTNKKILADLYVEYADEEKYNDSMRFVNNETNYVFEKYNISSALGLINETDSGNNPVVFSNGYFEVMAPAFKQT